MKKNNQWRLFFLKKLILKILKHLAARWLYQLGIQMSLMVTGQRSIFSSSKLVFCSEQVLNFFVIGCLYKIPESLEHIGQAALFWSI